MPNSSPPSRAAVSPSPRALAHAVGQHAQQRVADRMAERVVDLLEGVEIEEIERDLAARAAELGHGGVELLAKQGAIGEAGQTVVMRHVFHALARELLLGDVLGDAEQVERPVGAVAHGNDLRAQAANAVMRGVDRLLVDHLRLARLERSPVARDEAVGFLRGEEIVVGLADDGGARDAEKFLARAVQHDEAAGGRILDEHDGRHALDHAGEEGFALPEQRAGLLAARLLRQFEVVASCRFARRCRTATLGRHAVPL